MPYQYFVFADNSGRITGTGMTPDGTIPNGAILCTQNQSQNSQQYAVDVTTTLPSIVSAPASVLLSQQQQRNITVLQAAYQAAINAPVAFKNAAGVTSTYTFGNTLTHGGTNAQTLLTQILSAGSTAWTAGVWFDVAGVAQTMTFADLQGLALAVEAMETPGEQHLMAKIAAVQAQTTLPYNAIVW